MESKKGITFASKNAMDKNNQIKQRIDTILPYLNEKQSRLYLANEALSYGWGGISLISNLSGKSQKIIQLGTKELKKEVPMELYHTTKLRM